MYYRARLLAAAILISAPITAQAGFLKEAWNVVTDPLKLDASTQNLIEVVERTALFTKDLKQSLDASGKVIDGNIRDYLRNVDQIVGDSINKGSAAISNALQKAQDVERDVFANASQLFKCSVAVSLDQVKTTLAESLNLVGKTQPRFTFLGFEIGAVKFTPVDIKNPIEAYDTLRQSALARLNAMSDKQEAKFVEFVYGDMQRVADLTKCHYSADNDLQIRLTRDIYEFRRLHQSWAGLVK